VSPAWIENVRLDIPYNDSHDRAQEHGEQVRNENSDSQKAGDQNTDAGKICALGPQKWAHRWLKS
jgi:hypothetical protein